MRGWFVVAIVAAIALAARSARGAVLTKDGVDYGPTGDVLPEMLPVWNAVAAVWLADGLVPTLTDYWRAGDPGLHGSGHAIDFRLSDVPADRRRDFADQVSARLGDRFQVIVEDGTARWYYRGGRFEGSDSREWRPLHMHVELDG